MVVLACNGIDLHGIIKSKLYASSSSSSCFQVKASRFIMGMNATMFLKPKKTMLRLKKKAGPNMVSDLGLEGSMLPHDGFIFRQKFLIRSYEIGPDRKASVETLMNYSQETVFGHLKEIGLVNDGFNFIPDASKKKKKNLTWVMTKMQMVVDRYPTWGDVVQIDTWIATYGKIGMCCTWTFCDCETGEILVRGSSIFVMMNKETRKLSRFPNEVRAIVEQYFVDTAPEIVVKDARKWLIQDDHIADHVCKRLTPRWSDLDANQHVNNAKYVALILESVRKPILEKYDLASMTLDYYRECTKDSVLQSHTSISAMNDDVNREVGHYVDDDVDVGVDCWHVLRLDNDNDGRDGVEIMKGRSRWRPKCGVGNDQDSSHHYINSSNCCFSATLCS